MQDELNRILEAYNKAASQSVILATVVRTTGSSYRRPGARMLILSNGTTIGSISGGCLEQDVIAHAEKLRSTNESVLLTYDTTPEEDVIFGVGLGCKGVVEILVESANGGDNPAGVDGMLAFLAGSRKENRTAVIATIFKIEGALKGCIGERLAADCTGVAFSEIQDLELRDKIAIDSLEALGTGRSAANRYEVRNGTAEVFIEVVHAQASLVIFGAGYDAMRLSRLAKELGFRVTIVDRRAAYATAERFPEADDVMIRPPGGIDELNLSERTAAVVMTHHYETDRSYLKALLELPLRYLGLMGPRNRTERMIQDLRAEGELVDNAALKKLHNPVGLDIGAENPEQIALSIISEIQAVFSDRAAGFLYEKNGPVRPSAQV